VNAEFVAGLLDDVLEVVPVVPPEDDRVGRLGPVELASDGVFRGVGEGLFRLHSSEHLVLNYLWDDALLGERCDVDRDAVLVDRLVTRCRDLR